MIKFKLISLNAILLLLLSGPVRADFTGEVVKVIDGDTIDVLTDGQSKRVRLIGIDAPESRQDFGSKSKQMLAQLVSRQQVTVIENHTDRYGRILGMVEVKQAGPIFNKTDLLNVNYEMVAAGYAWAYRYHNQATDKTASDLERKARSNLLGLWSDHNAVEPWKWRQQQKRQ